MFSGVDIKKEMTRYRAGLASAPIAGFMVTYNKHTLGLEDLGTLEEQNWLNDQVKKDKCYAASEIPKILKFWILPRNRTKCLFVVFFK